MNTVTQAQTITEINRLHGENVAAAKMSLDRAIVIGELLLKEKTQLGHGGWLPWAKANLSFCDRTASRYIRCFKNRHRLKSDTLSDLNSANRLLSEKAESKFKLEPETPRYFLPDTGGRRGFKRSEDRDILVYLVPSTLSGYWYVSKIVMQRDGGDGWNDGYSQVVRKPVSAEGVCWLLSGVKVYHEDFSWSLHPIGPWDFNEHLFDSAEDARKEWSLFRSNVSSLSQP